MKFGWSNLRVYLLDSYCLTCLTYFACVLLVIWLPKPISSLILKKAQGPCIISVLLSLCEFHISTFRATVASCANSIIFIASLHHANDHPQRLEAVTAHHQIIHDTEHVRSENWNLLNYIIQTSNLGSQHFNLFHSPKTLEQKSSTSQTPLGALPLWVPMDVGRCSHEGPVDWGFLRSELEEWSARSIKAKTGDAYLDWIQKGYKRRAGDW